MHKQSSPRISSLGSHRMKVTAADFIAAVRAFQDGNAEPLDRLVADFRALAASCVSQDQTKGQG